MNDKMNKDTLMKNIDQGQYKYCNIVFENTKFESDDIFLADFVECTFNNVIFENLQMEYNSFVKCKFINCKIVDSSLDTINFRECLFDAVDLQNCYTSGEQTPWSDTIFNNCNFKDFKSPYGGLEVMGCIFLECIFENTLIRGAEMGDPQFIRCNMNRIELAICTLIEAKFEEVELRSAVLQASDLKCAQLKFINLEGSNLKETNLKYADLEGAVLNGVNFEGANLEGTNLRRTILES